MPFIKSLMSMCVRSNRPKAHLQPVAILLLTLGLVAMGLSGCRRTPPEEPTEPNILDTIPSDWVVIDEETPWKPINIDDDRGQSEFLLLYTYNNQVANTLSGPVGAAIYDLQDNTESIQETRLVSMPNQPASSYVPYRVLPNFWSGSATGFIAPRRAHADITVDVINRSQTKAVREAPSVDATRVPTETVPIQELLIRDAAIHTMTFVWWRSTEGGYGVANVYADAGFRNFVYETAEQPETPLVRFDGLHSFHDRSELCHAILYARETLTSTFVNEDPVDIHFAETPLGIQFCGNAPTNPYYPEAVVLKYLLDPDSEESLLKLDPGNKSKVADPLASAVREKDEPEKAKRMLGLFGPPNIRFHGDDSPATVCAEFLNNNTGEREAYRFRLRHVKPDVDKRTTDQFFIENVQLIPAPSAGPPVSCGELIPDGTPGRVPAP